MKIKILPLDWYCEFDRKGFCPFGSPEEEKVKQTNSKNNWNYDGPLSYIRPCEEYLDKIKELKLPERPLKYCIKARHFIHSLRDDRYICFTYQCGNWWRYIETQELFSDLHIPNCNYEESLILSKIPSKFLNAKSRKDVEYWSHWMDLRKIVRSVRRRSLIFRK